MKLTCITAFPEPAAEMEGNAPNMEFATDVEDSVNYISCPVIDNAFCKSLFGVVTHLFIYLQCIKNDNKLHI